MEAIPSSFRDRSGHVFFSDGLFYRTVNNAYINDYDRLMQSGLYERLQKKELLISHMISNLKPDLKAAFILLPEQLPQISYAWEWSFSMLKDAALCTLNNALEALEYGMILKDANTFNIQFLNGKPILIDTLSFEIHHEKESWIAYRQFCEQFVAPLVLMKYCNASLNKLLLAYPDGIPLDICKSMLPFKARWNVHVYLHIFLQSKLSSGKNAKTGSSKQEFSKQKLLTLLNGLKSFITSLHIPADKTTWDNYYEETILSKEYLDEKKMLVTSFLKEISFHSLLDLGSNDGEFSLMYQQTEKQILSLDEDRNCIERLYLHCKKNEIENITPLICDLTSPSPDIGWNNEERPAMYKRIQTDVTLALALIHHLAIAKNIPLAKIVSFLAGFSQYLIIEFVGKEDPKVKQLLANRKDIFDRYTLPHFKECLLPYYDIVKETKISVSDRTLFLLKRKG